MTAFASGELTWTLADRLVAGLALEPLALPPELARASGSHRGAPATIVTRAWRGPGVRFARAAHLQGGGLDIGNLLVLPALDRGAPIFGADFVAMNDEGAMAALDLSPVSGDPARRRRHHEAMGELARRVASELPGGGPLPAWATRCFSPWPLYTRFPPALLPSVGAAARAYTELYLRLAETPGPDDGTAAQADYVRAHREEDRGLRLMIKVFGEAWTARYLDEVLFPSRSPVERP